MDSLLDRFLRYVRLDTQSDETSATYPSTAKQLVLSRLLTDECRALGLADVSMDEFGIVMATVPGTTPVPAPTFALVAHVDTSPEYSSSHVNPQVVSNYDGRDLVLPGDPSKVLRASENPELAKCLGHTLITTDGSTLLGGDDKAGIAVIMTAAERLLQSSRPHAPVRLCFTCDEEIGRGTDKLDLGKLNALCGYTLDGGGQGEIDGETFSADQAIITVHGINTHPSIGKGTMVNAVRILSDFLSRLPTARLAPEVTDGRDGFLHPYHIEGGVSQAAARLILRDFETSALAEQAQLLETIAQTLRAEHPRARIEITTKRQYRNMRDGLVYEPRAIAKAEAAMRAVGLEPKRSIIRGGTDGSLLTEKGLPCPNLSTGQHNPHSPLEWASLDEMETATRVLVELAVEWGREPLT
ncbi:MAG: peptidase T [Planctomycetaceae bacterium]|nr:peptidase T [Planctomycetaceae bacterium]